MADFNIDGLLREIAMIQRRLYAMIDVSFAAEWKTTSTGMAGSWNVPLDLIEHKDGFTLYADMPGIESTDLKVEVVGNRLVLTGIRGESYEIEPESMFRIERPLGSFKRELTLPAQVEAEKVEAQLSNGVLTVNLPLNKKGSRQIVVE